MKILLIDHNDSFTFNIVEVLRHFKHCKVSVINYDDFSLDNVANYDKIILSPGPEIPNAYPKTTALIERYYQLKPILGICLGHQAICAFFGGDLYRLETVIHGVNKTIIHSNSSNLFDNIPVKSEVGLYHSWAVNPSNLSSEISVTSTTQDQTVMSIAHKKLPIYGIQFHPESFLTEYGTQLLKNFISLP